MNNQRSTIHNQQQPTNNLQSTATINNEKPKKWLNDEWMMFFVLLPCLFSVGCLDLQGGAPTSYKWDEITSISRFYNPTYSSGSFTIFHPIYNDLVVVETSWLGCPTKLVKG